MFTNKVNGTKYIGATKNFKNRMKRHRSETPQCAYPIYKALNKYGWDAFDIRVIETVDTLEQALHLETCWIAQLRDSGYMLYNLTDGGEGATGYKHSAEAKEKIRAFNLGKKRSEWARSQMSKSHLGKKVGFRKAGNTASTKYCPKCESVKSRAEFHKSGSRWDGCEAYCKCCRAKAQRNRAEKRLYKNQSNSHLKR